MRLISGPMATLSHPAFRILIEKFGGCDEYFTEMINAGSLVTNGPFEKFYLNPSPCPERLVWQLTSKNTELMLLAAKEIALLPGLGIDLNMGCSAPDIYKSGAGIGWMLRPLRETEEMVREVRKIIDGHNGSCPEKKRLSVKLRLGDDDFTDDGFFSFCDMLVSCGVELLTLHPRTKKEKLRNLPRYEYCQKIAERYRNDGVKVYVNGNICDKVSFKKAVSIVPDADGVMISRAAAQKPWIFKELRAICDGNEGKGEEGFFVDMKEIALDFISDVEIYQPGEFWRTRLQRFFTYFCDNFTFSHYARTQFLNAKSNEELRLCIEDFFEKCPDERMHFVRF